MNDLEKGTLNKANQPLISVVMNCYNSAKYLREAIDSVLAQSYENWEIIFWDNQSTDDSAEIFNSYTDVRLHYFLAPEFTKLGRARNLAIANAKGEWFGFLDCDDIWLPEKLSNQVNIIVNEDSKLGLVYGQCLVIKNGIDVSSWTNRQNKYANKTVLRILPEGHVFKKLLKFNFISLLTALVSRAAYNQTDGLSEHYEQAEDYELFIKIAAKRKVRAVQEVIALYRIHDSNASIGNEEKSYNEVFEIIGKCKPNSLAVRGLSYQYTAYALTLIKDRKLLKGVYLFLARGRLFDLFSILVRKITRRI